MPRTMVQATTTPPRRITTWLVGYSKADDDATDIDTTLLYGGGNIGEKTTWLVGYSKADDGRSASAKVDPVDDTVYGLAAVTETDDSEQLTWGIYHNLGGGSIGEKTNWLLGYSKADDDNAASSVDDPDQLTWGVYHNLGGGLKLYYEATNVDSENSGNDGNRHLIGMRVDF